jgi:RNA polymerase sigma-70 factor (ECF subfamily)
MPLARQVMGGDAKALEQLMRTHNRRLFRVARSILGNDAEAEDALQEGYIRAYRKMASFRGQASLSTWLTRIVVNQALEGRRRRRHAPEIDGDIEEIADTAEIGETPESLAMRSQLRSLIETSIDGLPETYRTVFIMRAVEGLSVEETADALGISEANTKTRFLRARALLRDALGHRIGPVLENVFAFDGGRCDRIVAHVLARLGLSVSPLFALEEPTHSNA